MKTYMAKSEDFDKKWFLIDGEGKTVGRLATQIANILRGKDKAEYTPHADIGDFVIVVNAEKLHFSGDKWNQKTYYRHTNILVELNPQQLAIFFKLILNR